MNTDTKICPKCELAKDFSFFFSNKYNRDGKSYLCKPCHRGYTKSYEERHRSKYCDYQKKYREANPEKYNEAQRLSYPKRKNRLKETTKNWYERFKKEHGVCPSSKRRAEDPLFKLISNIRNRINKSLKAKKINKNNTLKEYVGCSVEELKTHIESKFQPEMTWDNYGKWHIDHIVPLASAKTEGDIFKLNHYTNLQPLWALDNLKKGSK